MGYGVAMAALRKEGPIGAGEAIAAPLDLSVASLTLTRYRSYEKARLSLGGAAPLVVLTGPNGAGKTNVLEALSYLAPGRGLRRAALGEVTRFGADGPWAVAAELMLGDEPVRVGTGIEAGPASAASGDDDGDEDEGSATGRRLVRIDGETVTSTNALGDRWSVSWLTPQMDRLFIEAPSGRRRFLDRLVIGLYPDHSRQIAAYERVMRERNRLLADRGTHADPAWVSALEARMAEHGAAVAAARLEFAGQLAGFLAEPKGEEAAAFPEARLAIDGWLEGLMADGMAPVEAEAAYRAKLAEARRMDAATGRAAVGPHKTDLLVVHGPKDMPAGLCSTGEQKALLIALTLADARLVAAHRGRAPLLLLDEVAAHLDADRRAALFAVLASLKGQCWLTGTDRSVFAAAESGAEFFNVEGGIVRPAE